MRFSSIPKEIFADKTHTHRYCQKKHLSSKNGPIRTTVLTFKASSGCRGRGRITAAPVPRGVGGWERPREQGAACLRCGTEMDADRKNPGGKAWTEESVDLGSLWKTTLQFRSRCRQTWCQKDRSSRGAGRVDRPAGLRASWSGGRWRAGYLETWCWDVSSQRTEIFRREPALLWWAQRELWIFLKTLPDSWVYFLSRKEQVRCSWEMELSLSCLFL